MSNPLCLACGERPRTSAHANTKYCAVCRAARLRQPSSGVSAAQRDAIIRLAGTMKRWEIAEKVGVTRAAVHRCLREEGLRSNVRDYPREVVEAVSRVYEAAPSGQGKRAVREAFPDIVVRSIVERRHHHRLITMKRQVRWTGEQLIEAARMAGLVSADAQARYFGRPNAAAGSIKSLWAKHFGCAPSDINGAAAGLAYRIATPGVPAVVTAPDNRAPTPRVKVLWLDLLPHLREDVAPAIRQAVEALALFQHWLHGTADAATITSMIHHREETYGNQRRHKLPGEERPRDDSCAPAGFAGLGTRSGD